MAEPDRDRLLHHPTQSRHPQRLHQLGADLRPPHRLRGPLQPAAEPFDWGSPETTSAACSNGSPSSTPPLRHSGRRLINPAQKSTPTGRPDTSHKHNPMPPPGSHPSPRWQERVLVIIVAGPIYGEPPTASGTRVAQTQQGHYLIVDLAIDICKPRPEPHLHPRQARPSFAARAESRWLNEDFVDSGIFTPLTIQPRTPALRHQRTYAEDH